MYPDTTSQSNTSLRLPLPNNLPTFHISIRPTFDPNGFTIALAFTLTLSRSSVAAHGPLCVLYTTMPNGTTQCYTASQLCTSDDRGPLCIETRDEGRTRFYLAERATQGKVIIRFTATPVDVGPQTPIGGRYELRQDQGGLQFLGMSTIPIPWDGGVDTDVMYMTEVQWDLEGAPYETRGIDSFGEGLVQRVGPLFEVWRTVFKVGPVKSWPPWKAGQKEAFGFYWFGSLPERIGALPEICEKVVKKLAAFFRDDLSEENPYRIFVRNVTPAKGFGGTGGIRSFVLDYDDDIGIIKHDEIFYLLFHEIVHGWPYMQREEGKDLDLTAWYNEGVADYYASVLPYRFNLVSEAEYLKRINAKLTEYYTNPLRLTSNRDAQDNAWTSPNLQTLAYTRGMLYFLQLDAQIRRASNHMKCVDDLVLKLLAKRRNNQQHGITAWKALVWSVLGHNALEEFDAMNRGELIRLPAYTFGPEIGLTRVERRELDFGFDVSSFFRKVVVGLKDGSEAARAGIQEKDAIVWNTYVWQCQGDYERWMVVDTSRPEGGELKRLEFWPRSELLVESWIVSKECKSLEGSRVEERIPDDWEWIDLIDVLDGPIF